MAAPGLPGPALTAGSRTAVALLSDTCARSRPAAGYAYQVLQLGKESTAGEIERVKSEARRQQAGVIVGVGGGKSLEIARAAAGLNLPVVNCPTVASSGAPCSALPVVYTEDGLFVELRFFRRNPDLVLVDTQVIAGSPPRMMVAGMGDARAACFEVKTCTDGGIPNRRGGTSIRSALALAHLCHRALLEDGADALAALRDKTATPALERIVEANTLLC